MERKKIRCLISSQSEEKEEGNIFTDLYNYYPYFNLYFFINKKDFDKKRYSNQQKILFFKSLAPFR